MRTYDNGTGFTVCYGRHDATAFTGRWPCSTVEGRGSYQFDGSGNLIDVGGTAARNDGPDWLAFSRDCHAYGVSRLPILRTQGNRYETQDGNKCRCGTLLSAHERTTGGGDCFACRAAARKDGQG